MIAIFACIFYYDISTSSIVDFKVDKKTPQPLNVESWHKTGEIFARKMDSREPCDLIGKERGNFFWVAFSIYGLKCKLSLALIHPFF